MCSKFEHYSDGVHHMVAGFRGKVIGFGERAIFEIFGSLRSCCSSPSLSLVCNYHDHDRQHGHMGETSVCGQPLSGLVSRQTETPFDV